MIFLVGLWMAFFTVPPAPWPRISFTIKSVIRTSMPLLPSTLLPGISVSPLSAAAWVLSCVLFYRYCYCYWPSESYLVLIYNKSEKCKICALRRRSHLRGRLQGHLTKSLDTFNIRWDFALFSSEHHWPARQERLRSFRPYWRLKVNSKALYNVDFVFLRRCWYTPKMILKDNLVRAFAWHYNKTSDLPEKDKFEKTKCDTYSLTFTYSEPSLTVDADDTESRLLPNWLIDPALKRDIWVW